MTMTLRFLPSLLLCLATSSWLLPLAEGQLAFLLPEVANRAEETNPTTTFEPFDILAQEQERDDHQGNENVNNVVVQPDTTQVYQEGPLPGPEKLEQGEELEDWNINSNNGGGGGGGVNAPLRLNQDDPDPPAVPPHPTHEQWLLGREPKDKLNLISWLIDGCFVTQPNPPVARSLVCNPPEKNPGIKNHENDHPPEFQTFDGFFNNIFKTDLGAVDTPLLRRVPPAYEDGVYKPPTKYRVNPFTASDSLMSRTPLNKCKDSSTSPCGSRTGKTAFLVFFGQQVVEEMLDVQRPGCPPEYFNVPIPKGHTFRKNAPGKTEMPFLRSRYAQLTGQSPGNPRQQLNEITPWFDGGLVYGTAKGWADVLRTMSNGSIHKYGQLASENDEGLFPVINRVRLPLANPPPPARHCRWTKMGETARVDRFFVLGNPRGNENAFLLSFGVVLFRWHNQIAGYLHQTRPHWSGERIFQEARKWVIATYQSVVYYNWLPEWLGEPMPPYPGYDPSKDPQIEQFFQTAAMRFGHTLVTPGVYMRDYACAGCSQVPFEGLKNVEQVYSGSEAGQKPNRDPKSPRKPFNFNSTKAVRTCNIFWRPQEPLTAELPGKPCDWDKRQITDIDRLLMGMASQRAEREDHMIVEDLRGNVFGPLDFSRRDLMAVNIQRGRDHGTPDYNTAREAMNLPRICSVDQFIDINGLRDDPETVERIRPIVESLEMIHRNVSKDPASFSNPNSPYCWDNIDVWTGGILETNKNRPGPLFRRIIKDQYERIRDADRFWFENKQWKIRRFSDEQINRIRKVNVFDMVVSVTRMTNQDIQDNPFRLPTDDFAHKCTGTPEGRVPKNWVQSICRRQEYDVHGNATGPETPTTCFHLPQLQTAGVNVENCTKPATYDYFTGSEISYIITFIVVGLTILGIFMSVPLMGNLRERKKQGELLKIQKQLGDQFRGSGLKGTPFSAREWQGNSEGTRHVVVVLTNNHMIEIRNMKGELLRNIDLSGRKTVEVILVSNGLHLILKNPKEYDCVLQFEGLFLRESFYSNLKEKFRSEITFNDTTANLKQSLAAATTKSQRILKLEKFFKIVFAQAFNIDEPSGGKDLLDPKLIREVITTELTKAEFADALGMSANSKFVEKMFNLVDRDRNGFISFREFLDMLVIFSKGTAEDKAQLMFEMYDIQRKGTLSVEEFKEMIRSLIEAANADVKNDDVEAVVQSMLEKARLKRDSQVTLMDFQKLLSQYKDTLGYAQLNFSGNIPQEAQKQAKGSHRLSHIQNTRASVYSIYDDSPPDPETEASEASESKKGVYERQVSSDKDQVTLAQSNKQDKQSYSKWIELYRLQIFWCLMYTLVVIAIFAERAYYYSVEREHRGLRHIAGYGVTVTRGAASAMMFCYATLLLTMCRNIITNLRETFLHRFIPFDAFVSMHKYIAVLALLFTVTHVVGHGINFYHIATQPPPDLTCLFRDFFRPTHVLPKFHYWCWQTVTGITGILLVIQASFIYAFSTNYARTYAFAWFWIIHGTYPVFYILMIIHGSGILVQEPLFYTFLIGPLVLFVLDRFVTISRKKVEIPVIRADLLPSNVTKLEFMKPTGFEYKSGQWVRIACKALNSNEFHPFTLSSAPHEPSLTLHIRAVGPFTANIRQIYESSLPKVYLDGPYGEGHQDWWRYEVSVLVGGGIGVTPFASILKDVANNANPRNCKKIYFVWVTRTQRQFEWLVDIIRDVESHKIISVHVFVTQIYNKFDLRTVLLYICERHFQKVSNRSLFTGLKSITHFGRPNFAAFFRTLRSLHPNVHKFGIFSCGPLPMTKQVDLACSDINNDLDDENDTIFQHHFENF